MQESIKSEFYSDKSFWNNRFEKTRGYFDWYVGWIELKPYLINLVKKEDKILMVGCGNSQMSEFMYKDEFTNITNIDISDVVIEKMKNLYQQTYEKMQFLEMDATQTTFQDEAFDFTFDKGTLDALMCSKNLIQPKKLLREMFRVTKRNGYFAIVTYGRPEERFKVFNESLSENEFELSHKKVSLSLISNLINILKNNKNGDSVTNAIKDKEVLVKSLVEASITKLSDEREEIINKLSQLELNEKEVNNEIVNDTQISNILNEKTLLKEKLDKLKKKILQMKMMRLIQEKKSEKEKLENLNNNITDKSIEEKLPEENDARRTHCYLYIFKKL